MKDILSRSSVLAVLSAAALAGGCAFRPAGEEEERGRLAAAGLAYEERDEPPALPADPTGEDYLRYAFLNNADEPEMPVSKEEVKQKRAEIEAKIARLTADLPGKFPKGVDADAASRAWLWRVAKWSASNSWRRDQAEPTGTNQNVTTGSIRKNNTSATCGEGAALPKVE